MTAPRSKSNFEAALRRAHAALRAGRAATAERSLRALANLELHDARGSEGHLELRWSEGVSDSVATARGELAGKYVVADAPAP
jgi:hypothetical protein